MQLKQLNDKQDEKKEPHGMGNGTLRRNRTYSVWNRGAQNDKFIVRDDDSEKIRH